MLRFEKDIYFRRQNYNEKFVHIFVQYMIL